MQHIAILILYMLGIEPPNAGYDPTYAVIQICLSSCDFCIVYVI